MEAVHVAEGHPSVAARLELGAVRERLDVEVAKQGIPDGLLLRAVVRQSGQQPVGGNTSSPGSESDTSSIST